MPSGQAHQETNALRPRGTDSKKQQSWNATWAWLQWRGHARCGGVLWGAPGCSPHGSFGPQKSMSRGLQVTVGSSVSLTPLAKPDPGRPLAQRTPRSSLQPEPERETRGSGLRALCRGSRRHRPLPGAQPRPWAPSFSVPRRGRTTGSQSGLTSKAGVQFSGPEFLSSSLHSALDVTLHFSELVVKALEQPTCNREASPASPLSAGDASPRALSRPPEGTR